MAFRVRHEVIGSKFSTRLASFEHGFWAGLGAFTAFGSTVMLVGLFRRGMEWLIFGLGL